MSYIDRASIAAEVEKAACILRLEQPDVIRRFRAAGRDQTKAFRETSKASVGASHGVVGVSASQFVKSVDVDRAMLATQAAEDLVPDELLTGVRLPASIDSDALRSELKRAIISAATVQVIDREDRVLPVPGERAICASWRNIALDAICNRLGIESAAAGQDFGGDNTVHTRVFRFFDGRRVVIALHTDGELPGTEARLWLGSASRLQTLQFFHHEPVTPNNNAGVYYTDAGSLFIPPNDHEFPVWTQVEQGPGYSEPDRYELQEEQGDLRLIVADNRAFLSEALELPGDHSLPGGL